MEIKMTQDNLATIKEELEITKEDLNDVSAYLEDFLTFLPIAACDVSPMGIIIHINKAFEQLCEFNSLEITGEHLSDIFLEKTKIEEILNLIKERRIIKNQEFTLVTKNKKEVIVNTFFSARKDKEDNLTGCFLGMIDIDNLKKLQYEMEAKVEERTKELSAKVEEIEKSRTALMNILEDVEQEKRKTEQEKNKTLAIITNFSDGILVFDQENNLLLVNPEAERYFDIEEKEIIGKSITEIGQISNFKKIIDLIGLEIKEVFRKEIILKDNLILEVSTIEMVSDGERTGALIVLHDISREKMVERIKTEFVSIAAHQLRTPISAVKWTLKMLLDGDLGEITKEQKEFIKKTYQSNERMISLINDLLNITRIEEGRYLYKPVLSDFEGIVDFVIKSIQQEISRKKIILKFEKPKTKIPKIPLDVEKMKLAVQNLIDNAIKYTPLGGEINVLLDLIKFDDKKGKDIVFSVKDTGVGIPQDQHSRVFDKFFRGANVVRMNTEGTGLGIFIVKNIIEAHGGKIWFESEENKGTTFYFSLPVKEERE